METEQGTNGIICRKIRDFLRRQELKSLPILIENGYAYFSVYDVGEPMYPIQLPVEELEQRVNSTKDFDKYMEEEILEQIG